MTISGISREHTISRTAVRIRFEPGFEPMCHQSGHLRILFEPMCHPDANLVWAYVPSTWTHGAEMSMSFMRQLSIHYIVLYWTLVQTRHCLSTDMSKTMASSFDRCALEPLQCLYTDTCINSVDIVTLYGWIECPYSWSMIREVIFTATCSHNCRMGACITPHLWVA
jgi:hypothetical protein